MENAPLSTIIHVLKEQGYTDEEILLTKIQQVDAKTWMASAPIMPKKFIKKVMIDEMKDVVKVSPWNAFISIGCGIEFLGKCIDANAPTDWNKNGSSAVNFRDAIFHLKSFAKYSHLNKCRGMTKQQAIKSGLFDLYIEMRCALTHSYAPNPKVTLSHGPHEDRNLIEKNGVVNFNIDELYTDFVLACNEVIALSFPDPTNKMNIPRIWVNMTLKIE